jgi:hypothetical protein
MISLKGSVACRVEVICDVAVAIDARGRRCEFVSLPRIQAGALLHSTRPIAICATVVLIALWAIGSSHAGGGHI